jgi:hypothetical protein
MAEKLSEERQRLISRYMGDPVRAQSQPADSHAESQVLDATPARLDVVRWWISARVHRHPQIGPAAALIVLAVGIGWLVARHWS